jgi:hypothetical protein
MKFGIKGGYSRPEGHADHLAVEVAGAYPGNGSHTADLTIGKDLHGWLIRADRKV